MSSQRLKENNPPLLLESNDLYKFLKVDYDSLKNLLVIKDQVSPKEYHYRSFQIKKKTSGYRQIVAPKKQLRRIQSIINKSILEKVEPSEFAHGFRKGYSIVSNAKSHLNSEIIYNIDLKDFFTSIKIDKVIDVFESFGYTESVSLLLAKLCTITPRYYSKDNRMWEIYKNRLPHLPQGATTSPILSNLVCNDLDKNLNEIAQKYKFRFTRYADDITFSSSVNKKIPKAFRSEVFQFIRSYGFRINLKKERYSRNFKKRKVTGIIVHKEQLTLPRSWIRNLRAALHQLRFLYSKLKFAGTNDMIKNIEGRCSYAMMVNKEKYSHFNTDLQYLKNFKLKSKR